MIQPKENANSVLENTEKVHLQPAKGLLDPRYYLPLPKSSKTLFPLSCKFFLLAIVY